MPLTSIFPPAATVTEPASGESWYARNLVVPDDRTLLSTKTCSERLFACVPMAATVYAEPGLTERVWVRAEAPMPLPTRAICTL